jgi:hypothetical protein
VPYRPPQDPLVALRRLSCFGADGEIVRHLAEVVKLQQAAEMHGRLHSGWAHEAVVPIVLTRHHPVCTAGVRPFPYAIHQTVFGPSEEELGGTAMTDPEEVPAPVVAAGRRYVRRAPSSACA